MSAALQARIDDLEYRVSELEEALGANWLAPHEFGFTPAESRIMGCLLGRAHASRTMLFHASATPHTVIDDRHEKIVSIYICRMRQKLAPYGIKIITIWNFGYRLEQGPDLARLKSWTQNSPWLEIAA